MLSNPYSTTLNFSISSFGLPDGNYTVYTVSTTGAKSNSVNLTVGDAKVPVVNGQVYLLSPNGGENISLGTPTVISWTGGLFTSRVSVGLLTEDSSASRSLLVGWIGTTASNVSQLIWDGKTVCKGFNSSNVGTECSLIEPGRYKFEVAAFANGGDVVDYSDGYVSISEAASGPQITNVGVNVADKWENKTSQLISWNFANMPEKYDLLKYRVGLYTDLNGGMWGNSIYVPAKASGVGDQETNLTASIGSYYFNKPYYVRVRLYNSNGTEYRNTNGKRVEARSSQTFSVVAPGTAMTVGTLEATLASRSINYSVEEIGGLSTTTVEARFNLRLKAVGGDIYFGLPASDMPSFAAIDDFFVIYKDGLSQRALSVASATSYVYPTGAVTSGAGPLNFYIPEGNEVLLPVTFYFRDRYVNGQLIPAGNYSVKLNKIRYSNNQGRTWKTTILSLDWVTASVQAGGAGSGIPPSLVCADSDNGKNYEVKGTTRGKSSGGVIVTSYDYCSGTRLVEWFCAGDYLTNVIYACSNGCSNGACLTASNPILSRVTSISAPSTWQPWVAQRVSWTSIGDVPTFSIYICKPGLEINISNCFLGGLGDGTKLNNLTGSYTDLMKIGNPVAGAAIAPYFNSARQTKLVVCPNDSSGNTIFPNSSSLSCGSQLVTVSALSAASDSAKLSQLANILEVLRGLVQKMRQ